MIKKIILIFLVLLCSQFAFAESYLAEMLNYFPKDYLDYYFSLPADQRADDAINQFGQYEISNNGPALNAKYKPGTNTSPLVPVWQQKQAEYYFNEGLKIPEKKSRYY